MRRTVVAALAVCWSFAAGAEAPPREVIVANPPSSPIPATVVNPESAPVPSRIVNPSTAPVPSRIFNPDSAPVPAKIVNTTSTPVPTAVTNRVQVQGTVDIGTMPPVQVTLPDAGGDYFEEQFDFTVPSGSPSASVFLDPPPAGKVRVIEQLSVLLIVSPGQRALVTLTTSGGGRYHFPATYAYTAVIDTLVAGGPTQVRSDGPVQVLAFRSPTLNSASVQVTVAGRFVDAPAP